MSQVLLFEKVVLPKAYRLPSVIKKAVSAFSPQSEYERSWLFHCFERSLRRETTLYYVRVFATNEIVALFTLSLDAPEQKTSWLIIDYLYVLPIYRKTQFQQTGFKLSELVIAEIMLMAQKISELVTLDLLALQAAHQKLTDIYTAMGFVPLNRAKKHRDEIWMAISISSVAD